MAVFCSWKIPSNNLNLSVVFGYFFTTALIAVTFSLECTFINPCRCQFDNGSVIDLSPVAELHDARWKDMKPKNEKDPFRYYYNPCFNFIMGTPGSECEKGVAICQVNSSGNFYYSLGDQKSAKFEWSSDKKAMILMYSSQVKITNVTLQCSANQTVEKLVVYGETTFKSKFYEMTLISKCACPDGCGNRGLSTGSVLIILFLISVSLYLIGGIIYMKRARGAFGWELIPNYDFWQDFPLLVRDGCVYVISGCRPETTYERI